METPLNLKAQKVIRVASPSMTSVEADALQDCIDSNQISAGPRCGLFEKQFANLHNRKYGITCNSGTTALELALRAMNIGEGHTVAMPTMTMVACPNATLHTGAHPVFVDSIPETGNADFGKVVADAHMPVHLYGVPCEFGDIDKRRAVEDCSEAHFATFRDGKSVGSKGLLSTFSFFANKVVSLGEGGIVLTDDDEIEGRLRSLRAHAFTSGEHFHHKELALGCRLTELQAAIGLAQLQRKDWILAKREQVAEWYREMLDCWWLETMLRPPGSVWWVYPVLIRKGTKYTKDEVRRYLHEHGIETRSFFKPMHLQPHLKAFAKGKYPVAENLWERGLYLPLHANMTIDDVCYIADVMGDIFAW